VAKVLGWANSFLAPYPNPQAVARHLEEINGYPNLAKLEPPKTVLTLEPSMALKAYRLKGREAVLAGRILFEHAAAGEGTRLSLGPKFLIQPKDLDPTWPGLNLPLGLRRLAQLFFEIALLAKEEGLLVSQVLSQQKILVVTSKEVILAVAKKILTAFSSLIPPENFLFLGQAAFYGLDRKPNALWAFDPHSPLRLHNHGAMAVQKTLNNEVFRLDPATSAPLPLSQEEFFQFLGEFSDLVSLNVEDLDYLTQALDYETLGLAVSLGESGFGMVMEITGNDPFRPIKGGMCAYDPELKRDVVIESFRLKGVKPEDIKYLNKNFNHYPNPSQVFNRLKENGLFWPPVIYHDRVYFQPVQGDLNFLTKTAFFTRPNVKSINSLKSPANIPAALSALKAQDQLPGLQDFIASLNLTN
jgi:hypothetical protein